MDSLGVSLSGGGHRAALFGLGALTYLADAGANRQVCSVASVSGGSMANAYLAQEVDYSAVDGHDLRERVVAPLAGQLAKGGSLFATWSTWLYLAVLVVSGVATFGVWLLPAGTAVRLAAFVTAVVVWGSFVAGLRSRVCARAFRAVLFSRDGRATALSAIHDGVDHVLCATDLQAGEHLYFSSRFVCSFRLGWGKPAGLLLADAVQASACLPGAFPPRFLPTARHRFEAGAEFTRPRWMVLSDGGVYDNMADQWAQGLDRRKQRWPGLADGLREPSALVVVNASGRLGFQAIGRHVLPLIGELASLLRSKDILYDLTTRQRRAGLVGRFDRAEMEGSGLRGCLVHIPQSPFAVARAFADAQKLWPERAAQAAAVLERLGDTEAEWDAIAESSPKIKTTLSKLGVETTAQLLRHGYTLAMANCHVILGLPLFDVPDIDHFRQLATGIAASPPTPLPAAAEVADD